MATKKRIRRSEETILADTVTTLYTAIQAKIKKNNELLEEIFAALKPLRELEDEYRKGNKS